MMTLNPALRRCILIAVPFVLGVLELTHPFVGPNSNITARIAPIAAWWTTLHVLQIPLFALLAAALLILVGNVPGRAAGVARFCAVAFGVLYPAFDSAVGVSSGIIVAAMPGSTEIEAGLHALFWGPVTGMLDVIAAACWFVATVIAAVLLWRRHVSVVAAILLVISGIALAVAHVPPFGPIACTAFAVAAAIVDLRSSIPAPRLT